MSMSRRFTMSMSHKAFAFEWQNYVDNFLPLLNTAIQEKSSKPLIDFINLNLGEIKDPYEGLSVGHDWKTQLETGDFQEIADFALTAFYDPSEDFGLDQDWIEISESLNKTERNALLGQPILGFDPGRMGSYFQTVEQRQTSADILAKNSLETLRNYANHLTLLNSGLYVTF